MRGFEGSSSVAAKGPSAAGTGLRRDDPPPEDTVDSTLNKSNEAKYMKGH